MNSSPPREKWRWSEVTLALLGCWYLYISYRSYYESFFFDGIAILVIFLVGTPCFCYSIYKDIQSYDPARKLRSFRASLIGLFFFVVNLLYAHYIEHQLNRPSLIKAYYDGDYNGYAIDLKRDGHYIMTNGCGLGMEHLHGTYTLQDNLIKLDRSHLDNVITTNSMIIKKREDVETDTSEYIFLTSGTGEVLKDKTFFRVVEDHR